MIDNDQIRILEEAVELSVILIFHWSIDLILLLDCFLEQLIEFAIVLFYNLVLQVQLKLLVVDC